MKEENTIYDVIVIGAGISGLLLTKELSKKNKVLLIDENTIPTVHKCITSFKSCIQDTFLKKYISSEFEQGYIKTMYSKKKYIECDYISLDEKKLAIDIVKEVKENNTELLELTKFKNIKENNKKSIIIETNKGEFEGKLLVDCTGHKSIIAKKYNLYKRNFYWNIYGGIYTSKFDDPIIYEILENRRPINFFEILPINKTQVVTYAFDFNTKDTNDKLYEKKEKRNIEKLDLKKELGKKEEDIYGTIISGTIKRNSLNRVFLYGEAGMIAPIMTGFGFNNIIKTYKEVAKHLNRCLKNNTFSSNNLKYKYSKKIRMNQNLQLIAALFISNTNVKTYSIAQNILFANPINFKKFSTCDFTKKEQISLLLEALKKMGLKAMITSIRIKDIPILLTLILKIIFATN